MSRKAMDSILQAAADEALGHSAGARGRRRARRRLARELQRGIEQGVRERLGAGAPRRHRREIRTLATALAVFLAGAAPAGAATSTVRDGTLHVVGDAGEEIRITCSDGEVKVNGADPGSGAESCAEIRGIQVAGTSGNDLIKLSGVSAEAGFVEDDRIGGHQSVVSGLGGSDTIIGSGFDDDLDGGDGDDVLLDDRGDDRLTGALGHDSLLSGIGADVLAAGLGHNVADGGEGFDQLVETLGATSTSITLTNSSLVSPDRATELRGIDTVALLGGQGNDVMDAREATVPLDLFGGAGTDSLIGGGGGDRLMGGRDGDLLVGGASNDTLGGAAGNDTLFGGLGDDGLSSGDGHNEVDGGEGFDVLSETVRGGARVTNSSIEFDPAVARIRGIERVDLDGGPKGDAIDATETTLEVRLVGGAGNDTLLGGAGNDTLIGGSGEDRLDGGAGHDSLDGGSAADMLWGGAGNDTLVGGPGEDVIQSDAHDDVTHDPGNGHNRTI